MPFRNYMARSAENKRNGKGLLSNDKSSVNGTSKNLESERRFRKVKPHYNSSVMESIHNNNNKANKSAVNDLIGKGTVNSIYFPSENDDAKPKEDRRGSNSSNGSNSSLSRLIKKSPSPKPARKSSLFTNRTFPLHKSPKEKRKGPQRSQSNQERKLEISDPIAMDMGALPISLVESDCTFILNKPSVRRARLHSNNDSESSPELSTGPKYNTDSPTSVRLRKKPPNSPNTPRNRRQGFVLRTPSEDSESNSRPISHSSDDLDGKKSASVSRTSSNKVADRISRTIKALYDTSARQSSQSEDELENYDTTPLCQNNETEKVNKKVKSSKPPLPTNGSSSKAIVNGPSNSPKTDKRTGRKRSPKGQRRNNNVPLKDVDGSRRFKWRGSVNKIVKKFGTGQPFMPGGTFGVHLEDCPQSTENEYVPFVVDLCCRIVEEKGLTFTGIYRVPGNNASLTLLKDDLNQQGADAYQGDEDERFRDLNVVSSLLKLFFRKLPDPLFTNELYNDFIQMNRNSDPKLRLKGLRQLVHMLPAPHYETLKFLTLHLRKVADNSGENKMEVRNLAIVFGPTLVRSTASDNITTMVKDMSDQCRIVESIIQHADWFFKQEAESDSFESVLSPPTDQSNHEPVPSIGYLLANVGRTPGDNVSDNTSESSKSKYSSESEKDSFSKEVFDKLFGRKNIKKDKQDVDSADEHGGFEDRTSVTNKKSLDPDPEIPAPEALAPPPSEEKIDSPLPQPTHTPLYSDKDDISARLYEFYCEHLDKISKTKLPQFSSTESSPQVTPRANNQPFVYSIPDVAMVEKRHVRQKSEGMGDYNNPHVPYGNYHNVSGSQFKSTESLNKVGQYSIPSHSTPLRDPPAYVPPPKPAQYRRGSSSRDLVNSDGSSLGALADDEGSVAQSTTMTKHDSDSDDATIKISASDSLEDKLKYLTNLDHKPKKTSEPSRQSGIEPPYHEKLVDEPVPEQKPRKPSLPPKPSKVSNASRIVAAMTSPILGRRAHLKRTNPSMVAEQSDKGEPKKSAQKLYDERRIQREKLRQQRHAAKIEKKKTSQPSVLSTPSNGPNLYLPTTNMIPATPAEDSGAVTPDSDAGIPAFNRMDPKRRVIARNHEESHSHHIQHTRTRSDQNVPPKAPEDSEIRRKSFQKKMKKIARRHTLGAGDFPDCSFWEDSEKEKSKSHRLSISNAEELSPTHASTSLCDLTAAENNAFNQLSAVDRLLPKGSSSHSTIRGWMIQERMKNRTGIHKRTQREIMASNKSDKT